MRQRLSRWLVAAALALGSLVGCAEQSEPPPLKIAVLMNIGSWQLDLAALEWAVELVNEQGGVAGGRKLVLVSYSDHKDLIEATREVTRDPEIVAAVGPSSSEQVMQAAPLFIADQKVMLAPASTSGEVVRAFYEERLIWRTTESDIAQVETMLRLARERGAKRVALLTGFDAYGASFFDWFGFFAAELGLEVAELTRFDQFTEGCEEAMQDALRSQPDFLFAVPVAVDRALCMAEVYAEMPHDGTQLVFSDVGFDRALIEELGERAEGIEVLTTAAAPDAGFAEAHRAALGYEATNFAANMYDAILLLAYGLELSGGQGGAALADGIARAVDGRGAPVGWDRAGVGDALGALRRGEAPDLTGATGSLTYDPLVYTDVTESYYGLWRIADGQLVAVQTFATSESDTRKEGESVARTGASSDLRQDLAPSADTYEPAPLTGLWAVIAAVSSGWENYRHQADALAQYQLLRAGGVPDERIIMVGADDLANHAENPRAGTVRNSTDGADLRAHVQYDYAPAELSAQDFMDILAGKGSSRLHSVVESGVGDNLFVYLAGHGGREGVVMAAMSAGEATDDSVPSERLVTPELLGATFAEMFAGERYRRALVVVEACHGGVLGTQLSAPGVLMMSAASPFENSLGHNYDPALRAWLADEFSFTLLRRLRGEADESLRSLYEHVYHQVAGSHVSVYNARNFGDLDAVAASEFVVAPR